MAVQKTLQMRTDGRVAEVAAIDTTTGASDAGKIVATGSDGKIASTLMPTGIGADSLAVTASENLTAGDFVNLWLDTGTVKARKADATTEGKEADGFIKESALSGATATVYFEGTNTNLTGLTAGARYYLSATTAGLATATAPTGTGKVVQYLGRASSTTSIAFEATDGVILA